MKHDIKIHRGIGILPAVTIFLSTCILRRTLPLSMPAFDVQAHAFPATDPLAGRAGRSGYSGQDESHRFGLNAFKVLGGSYAIGRVVADKLGEDLTKLPFERLISTNPPKLAALPLSPPPTATTGAAWPGR